MIDRDAESKAGPFYPAVNVIELGLRGGYFRSFKKSLLAMRAVALSVFMPHVSRKWVLFLRSDDFIRQWVIQRPVFAFKPFGKYLNRQYRFSDRVTSLISHYQFVRDKIPDHQLNSIFFGDGLLLAEFLGKTGALYRLKLAVNDPSCENEGELLLKLETAEGDRTSFIVFNIGSANGMPRIEVGCLQGSTSSLEKAAARDFHSMRPKHLLVTFLYEVAHHWCITSIVCVKTTEQANFAKKSFAANYDGFWHELGGQLADTGFYALPAHLWHVDKAKPRDSSKAGRHRRRNELKNAVSDMLKQRLPQKHSQQTREHSSHP